ncbi:MAG: efflux RND transporter periplasmic adaptor subunit [Planctomycetes bacterium]|nr:efflux RND transporter periplasmic adaptor subunit [Planctomycetota bacterium]
MIKKTLLFLICTAFAAQTAFAQAGGEGIEAVTYPSDDVTLSFVRPGQIAAVDVTAGQSVKSGQLLVRQDDSAEQAELEHLRAKAQNNIRIRAAEAQLAQKRVDFEKIKQAAQHGGATDFEVRNAELEVTISELSLEMAKFEQKQDERKHREMQMHVERMRIVSPFDGVVEKLFRQVGEATDTLKEVIRVVRIDPLWIDVNVPRPLAESLNIGQAARIQLSSGAGDAVAGKVVHKGAVADAASNTLLVRVEMPNAASRPAGEHVLVFFDRPGATGPSGQVSHRK